MKVKKIIAWVVIVLIAGGVVYLFIDQFGFNLRSFLRSVGYGFLASGVFIALIWALMTVMPDD